MYLLGLGLILMALKYLAIGPVASWEWWQVLLPFGAAVVWWAWADATGYTKRRAVERMNTRAAERKQRRLEELDGSAAKRSKRR